MSFKNLKPKKIEIKTKVGGLTMDQQKKFIDLYADGKSELDIKHSMFREIKGDFRHLIKPHIQLLKITEKFCFSLMEKKEKPTTLTELRKTVNNKFPEWNNEIIDYLVGKIVSATGTFKEYSATFNKV